MPRILSSTRIATSPEKLWALMCDTKQYPDWVVPTERMVEVPEGPMGTGYVYKEYGGVPPFKSTSTWRVTEFDPPRRQVHVGDDGMMTIEIEVIIEPSGAETVLTQRLKFTPRWWIAPMSSVMWLMFMGRRAQMVMDQTQANAKKLLEAVP